jgi:hypothetical protein
MTDRYRVYLKVFKVLKEMTSLSHPGHLLTLAMMIAGIVVGRHAQLSRISGETAAEAKDKSIEMRLRRWVKNKHLDTEAIYMPFARHLLAALAHQPLLLVMDASQIGRGCMALMVSVVYKKRALPLAWLVYKGKKGHTTAQRHIEALQKVQPLIPANASVILLGDAEYDTTAMLQWLTEHTTWEYVLRTSPQIHVQDGETGQAIGDYPLEKGHIFECRLVGFTQQATVSVNLIGWWGLRYEKPIYLITSLTARYLACQYYRRRFSIETFFSDQKSRGFHIQKSHLSDPARLGRLLLAACLAYLWVIAQGLLVIAKQQTGWIDRTDRQDKSLFRLGLDWIHHALKRHLDFDPLFYLQFGGSSAHVR